MNDGTMDQRLNDEERALELERQDLLRVLIADSQQALEESIGLTLPELVADIGRRIVMRNLAGQRREDVCLLCRHGPVPLRHQPCRHAEFFAIAYGMPVDIGRLKDLMVWLAPRIARRNDNGMPSDQFCLLVYDGNPAASKRANTRPSSALPSCPNLGNRRLYTSNSMMKVDHLHFGERLPVLSGFLTLDPDYVWVLRNDDSSIAFAITAGRLHDVVLLQKPHGYSGVPVDAVHQLLRTIRDECLARGIRAFLIWHDPTWTDDDLTFYHFLEPYIETRVKFNGEIIGGRLSLMSELGQRSM